VAPEVSIVIPAHNQLTYCRQCIESIQRHTDHPYRLILVDNGSTDGVGEYFDRVRNAIVVHAGRNAGFPAGANLGLAHAQGHALLLNSDTIVPRGWLRRLAAALEREPRVGLVGPMSNCVSGAQYIEGLELNSIEEINAYAEELARTNAGTLTECDRLVGFCLLIRDETLHEIGPLDESFGLGNFEDDDYCLRARRAGYRVCIAQDCFVFHYGSRTFQALGFGTFEYRDLLERNEARFRVKWGLKDPRVRHTLQVSIQLNGEAANRLHKGDVAGAIRCYLRAISICPTFEQNYNDLGVVLWEIGEYNRAIESFRRALRLNPMHAAANENLRKCEQLRGLSGGTALPHAPSDRRRRDA
jgi:GT2 family glycosyltransferase